MTSKLEEREAKNITSKAIKLCPDPTTTAYGITLPEEVSQVTLTFGTGQAIIAKGLGVRL